MKIAKSRKLIALIVTFALAIASFIFSYSAFTANAAAADYFAYENTTFTSADASFTGDNVSVKLYGKDNALSFVNKLDFSDFAIKFKLPAIENGEDVSLRFTTDSYYVTGNPLIDGTGYETEIKNDVVFAKEDDVVKASFNGGNKVVIDESAELTVYLKPVADGGFFYLDATLDDGASKNLTYDKAAYYRITALPAIVGKVFVLGGNAEGTTAITLISINQKVSDGATFETNSYVQNFEIKENGDIKNQASPKVYLSSDISLSTNVTSGYNRAANTYKVICGKKYNVSLAGYSFLGSFKSSSYNLEGGDDTVKIVSTDAAFTGAGERTLKVKKGDDIVTTFTFDVKDDTLDVTAPSYYVNEKFDETALNSFKAYVNGLVKTANEEMEDSITVELKNLFNLVYDDCSSFSDMKATLYYWSENSSSSSSSLKISLSEAGHYRFIVTFQDDSAEKNTMVEGQFFYKDNTDTTKEIAGDYNAYVFSFEREINGEIKIEVSSDTATGYKGVQYSCSAFTVTDDSGNNYNVVYNLYYSKTKIDADSDGWKLIVSAAEANDEDATYGDFTYDEIKAINYDGELKFTPDRVGFYKITCSATSKTYATSKSDSAVFEVKEQVKTVVPDTHWLANNVWSVVFLSVGTLSLIGIIVLLFIKPKEESDK